MRRHLTGAALALAALLLAAAPATATTEPPQPSEPPETTEPPATTAFTLDDAQLAWGLSNEASNRAFAPGTVNMLGAGVINPGGGGRTVTQALWKQRAGRVSIEKAVGAERDYRAATWQGLTTQSDGTPLGSPGAGTFSNHRVVIDGGTGTVDPRAGTASIRWRGSFSVLFYSGMSTFTVTDPELEVTPRRARLLGTLGGWGSSMDDASRWDRLKPVDVVLADLDRKALRLPTAGGVVATPAYAGVRYAAPSGATPQVRTGDHVGSWPRSFVDFGQGAGSAAYWYSSGGTTDRFKAATPMTVSWEAGDPVEPPTPPAPVDQPGGTDQPDGPDAPAPPAPVGPVPGGTTPSASGTGGPGGGGSGPAAPRPPAPGGPLPAPPVPHPVSADLTPLAAPATAPDPDHRWHWWLGALLLLGAAALVSPAVRSRTARTTARTTDPSTSRTTPRGTS